MRTRIVLAVLAGVLPAVGFSLVAAHWQREAIREEIQAAGAQLTTAARSQQHARAGEELFAAIAASDEMQSLDRGHCHRFLSRLDAASSRYIQVRLFAADGTRICGDAVRKSVRTVAAEWWFREAISSTKGVFVGEVPDPTTGQAMSVFARSLADARRRPRAVLEIGIRSDIATLPAVTLAHAVSRAEGVTRAAAAAAVASGLLALAIAWIVSTRIVPFPRKVRLISAQPLAKVRVIDVEQRVA